MHINSKILDSTNETLSDEFRIYIQSSDWDLFKSPITDNSGNFDMAKFIERQKKSIQIIQDILRYHGKDDIVPYLENLASIEPRIQELQPWVRDHVVHAINTFILGVYILKQVNFPKRKFTRFNNSFMWKLCGPTHDLGYPIEIAHNVQKKYITIMNKVLDELDSPSPRLVIDPCPYKLNLLCNEVDANDLIQERLFEWDLDINIADYYTYLSKLNRIDHGVISALVQLKLIDALYQKHNPGRENKEIIYHGLSYNQLNFTQDIVSSSAALFLHNIVLDFSGFSHKIDFNVAPLAFLLFLCDTFQEWDRFAENRPIFSGNDFDIECGYNNIALYLPKELQDKVASTLNRRLAGLRVTVNNMIAVE